MSRRQLKQNSCAEGSRDFGVRQNHIQTATFLGQDSENDNPLSLFLIGEAPTSLRPIVRIKFAGSQPASSKQLIQNE
jgi:hypothetical protein